MEKQLGGFRMSVFNFATLSVLTILPALVNRDSDEKVSAMVTERWGVKGRLQYPNTLHYEDQPHGNIAIRIDLSALPVDVEVYRARLFVHPTERRRLNIVPGKPVEGQGEGAQIKVEATDRSLQLAPPYFQWFDTTEVVRDWVQTDSRMAGWFTEKTTAQSHAATLLWQRAPKFDQEKTCLEIAYKGVPSNVPPQVRGLDVFHRSGQTFITWQEVAPLITAEKPTWGEIERVKAEAENPITYRIYAHTKPIDAANLHQAELMVEVEPLSCYNVNGRNIEYLIGQAMIQPDEMGELARDHNSFMYTWGMDSQRMERYPVARFVVNEKEGPLPMGTGLYVHHPDRADERYYAVVSCRDGVENTLDFSSENSFTMPVAETVGMGQPVNQGPGLWGPFFDYPGQRQVYVQWCASPLAPRPNMYFNWTVLVPTDIKDGARVPVELFLHTDDSSYAKPYKKFRRDSIQIAPHDYPFSGWYGFNDAYGTLKTWDEGVVRNHTQKRIIAFLEWAKKEFPIDEDRVIVSGSDGAAMLAMNYRDMFAYALITGFRGGGKKCGRVLDDDQADQFISAWGPSPMREWPPQALIRNEDGWGAWGWAMLDQLALLGPRESMPLSVCEGRSWGALRAFANKYGSFYANMEKAHQPLIVGAGWNPKLVPPDYYTGLWRGLDITRNTPVPAFTNSSLSADGDSHGNVNWHHTWRDVLDEPHRFQITIEGQGTVDLTLRRLQRFKVQPGDRLQWKAEPLPDEKGEEPPPQSGVADVDSDRLFTLKELEIPQGGLVVEITHK